VPSKRGEAGVDAVTLSIVVPALQEASLPSGFPALVARALADPRRGGNSRSRWSGIATGDQALFVRRRVFETVGGYPEILLVEDVELSRRLKPAGRLDPALAGASSRAATGRRESAA
jgi:hypothetical protein